MSMINKLLVLAVPLLLLVLTGVAGYAYSQIRYLSLPIPQALALFSVVLPLITGLSTQGACTLIQRSSNPSKNDQYQPTIPFLFILGFQLMYETIIATLAITYIVPPSSLQCGLKDRWAKLFREMNWGAIRAVQDSFNCCGLNSVFDMAWPNLDQQRSPCAENYGRSTSCFGPWRQAEQTNAGLLLLVAVVVFIIKALSIISLLTTSPWTRTRWARPFHHNPSSPTEDTRATMRRLIEEANPTEEYHDEPNEEPIRAIEAPSGEESQRPRVEPSGLVEHGNE